MKSFYYCDYSQIILFWSFVLIMMELIMKKEKIIITDTEKANFENNNFFNNILFEQNAADGNFSKVTGINAIFSNYLAHKKHLHNINIVDYKIDVLKKGKNKYSFRIKNYNNTVLGLSNRYPTKKECLKAVVSLKCMAASLKIIDDNETEKNGVIKIEKAEETKFCFKIYNNESKLVFKSNLFETKDICVTEVDTFISKLVLSVYILLTA